MEYNLPILSALFKSDLQLEGVCSCGSMAEVAKSWALLLSLDEVTESCGTHVGCIESLANAQCRESILWWDVVIVYPNCMFLLKNLVLPLFLSLWCYSMSGLVQSNYHLVVLFLFGSFIISTRVCDLLSYIRVLSPHSFKWMSYN